MQTINCSHFPRNLLGLLPAQGVNGDVSGLFLSKHVDLAQIESSG